MSTVDVARTGLLAIDGGRPLREHYLVFGQPVIEQAEIDEVVDSMKAAWIGTGPKVGRFERMVADYVGAPYGRALNSCTAGLQLTLEVAGLGAGDEVITTPYTFAATVNAILHAGATPVLVDVERGTQNIDPNRIREAISPRTKAILPVHMAGRPVDLDAMRSLATEHGLLLIDDAAHALGAEYHGGRIGSLCDASVFSFYATKNITTGEGGMVTTSNLDWAEGIETYALHGLSRGAWQRYSDDGFRHYGVVVPGYKFNMTDLAASIGLHQFPRLEAWRDRREQIWSTYDESLGDLPVETPAPAEPDTVHARHLYTLMLDLDRLAHDRDWVQQALHAENIGTGIHFIGVHRHPWYAEHMPWWVDQFPVADELSDRTISLPLSPGMTDQDVDDVVAAVRRVLLAARR